MEKSHNFYFFVNKLLFVFLFVWLFQLNLNAAPPSLIADGVHRVTGLVGWYDPSSSANIVLNGSAVSQVYDRAYHAMTQNLYLQSETFQTTWVMSRCNAFGASDTGEAGAGSFANTTRTTDPVGGNNADFVQEDSTASNSHLLQQSVALPAGQIRIMVYAKAAGRNWIRLTTSSSMELYADFDVNLGTVGVTGSSGVGSGVGSSIVDAGNGWYRCIMTGTLSTAATYATRIYLESTNNTYLYNGDNTSGVYLYGASAQESVIQNQNTLTNYVTTTTVVSSDVPNYLWSPAASQPGTNVFGSRLTLSFDGSSDWLQATKFSLANPVSIVANLKVAVWAANGFIIDGSSSSGLYMPNSPSGTISLYAGGSFSTLYQLPMGAWNTVQFILNGASSSLYFGFMDVVTGNPGSTAMNGLTLGTSAAKTAFANCEIGELCIYNKSLETNVLSYIARIINSKWGMTNAIVVFDGDSRSTTYPRECMANSYFLNRSWHYWIQAQTGQTVETMVSSAATDVDVLFNGKYLPKIVVIWGGVNSARELSDDAATIWSNLSTYCDNRRSAGWKVVLCTEIDAQDTAANNAGWNSTVYPALNTLISNNWSDHADALADLGANVNLQDATNTNYFNADKLHLIAAGYTVVAGIVATAISNVP